MAGAGNPDFRLVVGADIGASKEQFRKDLEEVARSFDAKPINIPVGLDKSSIRKMQSEIKSSLSDTKFKADLGLTFDTGALKTFHEQVITTLSDTNRLVSEINKKKFGFNFSFSDANSAKEQIDSVAFKVQDYTKALIEARNALIDLSSNNSAIKSIKNQGADFNKASVEMVNYGSSLENTLEQVRKMGTLTKLQGSVSGMEQLRAALVPVIEAAKQLGFIDFDMSRLTPPTVPASTVSAAEQAVSLFRELGLVAPAAASGERQVAEEAEKLTQFQQDMLGSLETIKQAMTEMTSVMRDNASAAGKSLLELTEAIKQAQQAMGQEPGSVESASEQVERMAQFHRDLLDTISSVSGAVNNVRSAVEAETDVIRNSTNASEENAAARRAEADAARAQAELELETTRNITHAYQELIRIQNEVGRLTVSRAKLNPATNAQEYDRLTESISHLSAEYQNLYNSISDRLSESQNLVLQNHRNEVTDRTNATIAALNDETASAEKLNTVLSQITNTLRSVESEQEKLRKLSGGTEIDSYRDLTTIAGSLGELRTSTQSTEELTVRLKELKLQFAEVQQQINRFKIESGSRPVFGDIEKAVKGYYDALIKLNGNKTAMSDIVSGENGWVSQSGAFDELANALNRTKTSFDLVTSAEAKARLSADDLIRLNSLLTSEAQKYALQIEKVAAAEAEKARKQAAADNNQTDEQYYAKFDQMEREYYAEQERRAAEVAAKKEQLIDSEVAKHNAALDKEAADIDRWSQKEQEALNKLWAEQDAEFDKLSSKATLDLLGAKLDTVKTKMEALNSNTLSMGENFRSLQDALAVLASPDASLEQKQSAYATFNDNLRALEAQVKAVSAAENGKAAADRAAADATRQKAEADKESANSANAELKKLKEEQDLLKSAELFIQRVTTAQQKWSNTLKDGASQKEYDRFSGYITDIQKAMDAFRNHNMTVEEFRAKLSELNNEFAHGTTVMKTSGNAVKSWAQNGLSQLQSRLAYTFGMVNIFMKIVAEVKKMISTAVEIDTAMNQLQIVTRGSGSDMAAYFKQVSQTAKETAQSTKDLIDATTVYARLGYTMDESAVLAKYTAMLQGVGDIQASAAQDALTAIIKAFGVHVDDIEGIMDKLVTVGNNFPISVSQIAEGMNNAGSMLAVAGNSFEESVALLTAANTTTQDISKASTGLRTIAARIRKTTTELDELGEAINESKYEEMLQALAGKGVSLTTANGEYRSTYDVLKDIASVWGELTSMEQAAVTEALASTRQQNIFSSIITQFSEAEDAMKAMGDSEGALEGAYGTYLDSIQAHVQTMKAAFADLSATFVNSDLAKGMIDLGTDLIEKLTAITSKLSPILAWIGPTGTLATGGAIVLLIKNLGKIIGLVKDLNAVLGAGKQFGPLTESAAALRTKLLSLISVLKAAAPALAAFAVIYASLKIAKNFTPEAQFEKASAAAKEATEKIEELNQEYETNRERIKELNELKTSGEIGEAQETELEMLQAQNEVLELQLSLYRDIKAAKEAEQQGSARTILGDLMANWGQVGYQNGLLLGTGGSLQTMLDDYLYWVDKLNEAQKEAARKGKTSTVSTQFNQAEVNRARGNLISGLETIGQYIEYLDPTQDADLISLLTEGMLKVRVALGFEYEQDDTFSKFKKSMESGPVYSMQLLQKEAELTEDKVNELAQEWPQFAAWMEENGWTPAQVVEYIGRIKKEATEAVSGAGEEVASEAAVSVTEGINKLKNAVKESFSDTGMSTEAINDVISLFGGIDGFDRDKLFETSVIGVRMNAEELRRLSDEYVRLKKLDMDRELSDLINRYKDLEKEIEMFKHGINSQYDYYELQKKISELDSLGNQIEEARELRAQFEGLTSAYNEWINAQQTPEEFDPYANITKGYETAKKYMEQGWINSNYVNKYLDLIYGTDRKERGFDNETAFANLTQKIAGTDYSIMDFFTLDENGEISPDGLYNFLTAVNQLDAGLVTLGEDGSVAFDWNEEQIQRVSELTGLSVDAITELVRAMKGVSEETTVEADPVATDGLSEGADEAAQHLADLGATKTKINVDPTSVEEAEESIETVAETLEGMKGDDGNVDLTIPGAAEAKTVLEALIQKKKELENPLIMSISTDPEDQSQAEQDLSGLVSLLQDLAHLSGDIECAVILGDGDKEADLRTQAAAKIREISAYCQEHGIDLGIDLDDSRDPDDILRELQEKYGGMSIDEIIRMLIDDSEEDKYKAKNHDIDATIHYKTDVDGHKISPGFSPTPEDVEDPTNALWRMFRGEPVTDEEWNTFLAQQHANNLTNGGKTAYKFDLGSNDIDEVTRQLEEAQRIYNEIVADGGLNIDNWDQYSSDIVFLLDYLKEKKEALESGGDKEPEEEIVVDSSEAEEEIDKFVEENSGQQIEETVAVSAEPSGGQSAEERAASLYPGLFGIDTSSMGGSVAAQQIDTLKKLAVVAEEYKSAFESGDKSGIVDLMTQGAALMQLLSQLQLGSGEGGIGGIGDFLSLDLSDSNTALASFMQYLDVIQKIADARKEMAEAKGNEDWESYSEAENALTAALEALEKLRGDTSEEPVEAEVSANTEGAEEEVEEFVEENSGKTIEETVTVTKEPEQNPPYSYQSANVDAAGAYPSLFALNPNDYDQNSPEWRQIELLRQLAVSGQAVSHTAAGSAEQIEALQHGAAVLQALESLQLENGGLPQLDLSSGLLALSSFIEYLQGKAEEEPIEPEVVPDTSEAEEEIEEFVEENSGQQIEETVTVNAEPQSGPGEGGGAGQPADFSEASESLDDVEKKLKDVREQVQAMKEDGSNLTDDSWIELSQTYADLIQKKAALENPELFGMEGSMTESSSDLEKQIWLLQQLAIAKERVKEAAESGDDDGQAAALQWGATLLQALQEYANEEGIIEELQVDTTDAETALETFRENNSGGTIEQNVSLTTTSEETIDVDDSDVENYKPEDKNATVHYGVSVKNKSEIPGNVSRRAIYHISSTGTLPNIEFYGTAIKYFARGTAHAQGTAFAGGSSGRAFRGGYWGTKDSGVALGGEIGEEIIVRDGRWYSIGEDSAEMFHYKKGDIIFNADQTEQIFKYGKIKSGRRRAKAYASGTAFNYSSTLPARRTKSSDFKTDPTNYGKAGSGYIKDDSDSKKIDWIEVLIDRIERAIKSLTDAANSAFLTLEKRLTASTGAIDKIKQEIAYERQAYERYIKEANGIGLDDKTAKLVREGKIDITKYNKDTADKISQYKEWYEKALSSLDKIDELHEDMANLYKQDFENVEKDFDNQIEQLDHRIEMYNKNLSLVGTKGYLENAQVYKDMEEIEQKRVDKLNEKLTELQKRMKAAVDSEEIAEGSEAWYDMQSSINDVEEALADANIQLEEYKKSIRQVRWDAFDYAQSRMSDLTSETEFLVNLLRETDLFTDKGQFTDKGMAAVGLHAVNYNAYMDQARRYYNELAEVEKELAKDEFNKDLIERKQTLLNLQRKSIEAAEKEKDAVSGLVEEGIQRELDSLKELIENYKDALDSSKDLYDFQKQMAEKTKDVADIQKQLAAYAGDTSEENRARLQALRKQLADAENAVKDAEYERYVSEQKQILDDLYSEYEEILNKRLDDVDALMRDMITETNRNASEIISALKEAGADVGYSISDGLNNLFASSRVVQYVDGFEQSISNVSKYVEGIFGLVSRMVEGSAGVKAYASGGLVDYTGMAHVDGSRTKPELMLNAADTENFLALRDALRSKQYMSGISAGLSGGGASVGVGTVIENLEVSIPIDHVEDYNDLLSQMQQDPKFERLIAAMTENRYLGGNSLSKRSVIFR